MLMQSRKALLGSVSVEEALADMLVLSREATQSAVKELGENEQKMRL